MRFNQIISLVLISCQLCWFLVYASSKRTYGDCVVSKLIDVYDGDTFKVNLSSMPPIVGDTISVRINGIDTPEMRSEKPYERELAQKAKLYAEKRLKGAKIITLKNMWRDKYFRILADVYVDRWSLGKEMIRVGLAVEYDGGTMHEW